MEHTSQKIYTEWRTNPGLAPELQDEMQRIENKADDIADRFARELTFGTGGLRGVLGAGTNRMNVHTVARATQGLCAYLKENFKEPSCAIGYDSRNFSKEFATIAAEILASHTIKVWLYDRLMPTPMLSFAVRELHCSAGIVITASHNPAEYNGYKVYDHTGCQITDRAAQTVQRAIDKASYFALPQESLQDYLTNKTVEYIQPWVVESYYRAVAAQSVAKFSEPLQVVYSALHGSGAEPVPEIISRLGAVDLRLVLEQQQPDGNFPTAPYPNPEKPEALALMRHSLEINQGDIGLATDPDCDRLGVLVFHEGRVEPLTGNEIGVLLLDYLCKYRANSGTLPHNAIAIKTIVTTEMAGAIAAKYGVELEDKLTGFKYIGERIGQLEEINQQARFVFGFEESCGYLAGSYVRDKDAVLGAYLVAEMAGVYKEQGKTLLDVLEELYTQHGYYQNKLLTFAFKGLTGMDEMKKVMDLLREENHQVFPKGWHITNKRDYLQPQGSLPKSNVISFTTEEQGTATVRPSGTEPQLKVYLSACGKTAEKAKEKIKELEKVFATFIHGEA